MEKEIACRLDDGNNHSWQKASHHEGEKQNAGKKDHRFSEDVEAKTKSRAESSDDIPVAYKIARANMGISDQRIVTIPHYMVMFL